MNDSLQKKEPWRGICVVVCYFLKQKTNLKNSFWIKIQLIYTGDVPLQLTNIKTIYFMYLHCGEIYVTKFTIITILSVKFSDIKYIKNHKFFNVTK